MYNNKLYNTRNAGRYNNAGQFVPATEQPQQFQKTPRRQLPQQYQLQQQLAQVQQQAQQQQAQQQQAQQQQAQQQQAQQQQVLQQQAQQQQQVQQSNLHQVPIQDDDIDIKPTVADDASLSSKQDQRPAWMKSKLGGVKKIPNKERRRRQNETLRRLLTPKNALMVLNEMMPREQLSNQFTVEAAQSQFFSKNNFNFCADLTLEGNSYKGYGENKLSARNNAAEQAIRDLIIKKMNKVVAATTESTSSEIGADEESLPMIQLASFALHKLFAEWEEKGHKVPHLKPSNASQVSESGTEADIEMRILNAKMKPLKPRVLPSNAASMHPCMLLSYMKPGVEYRELGAEGDKPQNMIYTMGVDVDGITYIGKASNKKEARKAAARSACATLYFGVDFEANATDVKPVHGEE